MIDFDYINMLLLITLCWIQSL